MATLVPCLDALRSEFNRNFPRRDKGSDGWIGDAAHAKSKSDHNPDARGLVHAIDVDEDLRSPGVSMRACVAEVVQRHRTGRDNRLTYVIYERTIWSDEYDWRPRAYAGANPHDKHAHFSASYVRARENDRRPFGVEDIVTQEDRDDIVNRVTANLRAELGRLQIPTPQDVWDKPRLRNAYSGVMQSPGLILSYVPSRQGHLDTQAALRSLDQARSAYEASESATDQKVLDDIAALRAMVEQLAAAPKA